MTTNTQKKDAIMISLWRNMVRDQRAYFGMPAYLSRSENELLKGISAFRFHTMPQYNEAPCDMFKALYQAESFFNRYIFEDDVYSDDDLKNRAYQKYLETQDEVTTELPQQESIQKLLDMVSDDIASLLGPYDADEHIRLAEFGRNAAFGLLKRESYLDTRLQRVTMSEEQLVWWTKYVAASNGVFPHVEEHLLTDHLVVTAVPKKWESYRTIKANTTVGGLMTAGLGNMLVRRLEEDWKLSLSNAQDIHKELARHGSITGNTVTMDMSKASDMVAEVLLKRVLPPDWFEVLKASRISDYRFDTDPEDMRRKDAIFMSMGIGYTFPLQTIIFMSLLRCILKAGGFAGDVRVFGDDCIYPRIIHGLVIKIFPMLGFQINEEKTFATGKFRESCGGDYYRGYDVRPFMPKTTEEESYEQFLYKLYNGFFSRQSAHMYPTVERFLLWEIAALRGTIYQVPPSYPVTSGIRVIEPKKSSFIFPWSEVKTVRKRDRRFTIPNYYDVLVFKSVQNVQPEDRPVRRQYPYLWEWLRKNSQREAATCITWSPLLQRYEVGHLLHTPLMNYTKQEQAIRWKRYNRSASKLASDVKLALKKRDKNPTVANQNFYKEALRRLTRGNDVQYYAVVDSKERNVGHGPRRTKCSFWE